MDWSAWRLLLSPARPAFDPLGLAGVGGVDPGLAIDAMVGGDEPAAFVGVDGSAVGVAQQVGLTGAPAGRDAGEQCGRDVAGRRVVVAPSLHESLVLRGQLGVDLAGVICRGVQGFAQQWVAGFGQSVLVMALSGLVEFGDQPGVRADRRQGVEAVWITEASGDDRADHGADAGC